MAKNISISLDTYFENFVNEIIKEGRFSNVSEVMRAGLSLLEKEEQKHQAIIEALKKGEESEDVENFTRESHMKYLHDKYLKNEKV